MELWIPCIVGASAYEGLGMTAPIVFLLYDTLQIVLDSFLHHILQRNVVLGGDATAIFVFRRVVRYCPVQAVNFQSYIAPLRAYRDPLPHQRLTAFISSPDAKRGRLGENDFHKPRRILHSG